MILSPGVAKSKNHIFKETVIIQPIRAKGKVKVTCGNTAVAPADAVGGRQYPRAVDDSPAAEEDPVWSAVQGHQPRPVTRLYGQLTH